MYQFSKKNIYCHSFHGKYLWHVEKAYTYIIVKNSLEIKCGFVRVSEKNELQTVKKNMFKLPNTPQRNMNFSPKILNLGLDT